MVKSRSLWSGGYHADFTTILCFVCRATNYWLCANSIDELPHVFFEEHNKSKRAKGYYYFSGDQELAKPGAFIMLMYMLG